MLPDHFNLNSAERYAKVEFADRKELIQRKLIRLEVKNE
jgi:hypothetical protein